MKASQEVNYKREIAYLQVKDVFASSHHISNILENLNYNDAWDRKYKLSAQGDLVL